MAKVNMPEYPDNSYNKEKPEEVEAKTVAVRTKKGGARIKKKGLGKKFSETFLAEDAETVGRHLYKDVLAPAGKDTIRELVTRGLDMFLYRKDEYRPSYSSSRSKSKSGRDREYYSYDEPDRYRRNDSHARLTDRGRNTLSFDIEFDYYEDAKDAYDFLKDKMRYEEYPFVGVRDLFEYKGLPYDWSYDRYGWYSLEGMAIRRVRDKWILKLPRAEVID